MAHDHSSQGHVRGAGNERAIAIAALITGSYMFAEVIGGLASGSLALLADAGHMLSDFVSLVLAWLAFRLARRPADWRRTYGYDRFSVLAAFVNGITLFVIAGWICFEAYKRFDQPVEVLGGLMLWVALGGLVANILSFWVLSRQESDNLNVRAALLHVAGDLLGSVGALIASIVIIFTGWMPIDPLLSVLVALIILRSAWRVVKESGHILLEGAPKGFDSKEVAGAIIAEIPGITDVRHIHAWSITQERAMVTMEITVGTDLSTLQAKKSVKKLLEEKFSVEHTTVEVSRLLSAENESSK